MPLLAFDRARLEALRHGIGAALDDLHLIRCDDSASTAAIANVRVAARSLGERWLPRVQDVLNSKAMISCVRRPNANGYDVAEAPGYSTPHGGSMESITDPLPVLGPASPEHHHTFDEVLSDVGSGTLLPMAAPLDANGRAGARYESLSFAPTAAPVLVGIKDLTPDLLKVIDFFSDGLPVAWREHRMLSIYYLADARATSAVHVLSAYDRDEGPETLSDMTKQATVSGYMIIQSDESVAEVTMSIGDDHDPTKNVAIVQQATGAFKGMFFPDDTPDLQPISSEPRFESPDMWTFTTSAAPMVDGWGTWQL